MRALVVRYWLLLVILAVVALLSLPVLAQPQSDPLQERAVIAAINAWRIQLGLAPLQANPTLMRMALSQAQYVMSLPSIPAGGDIHIDRNGNDPRVRAVNPPYNWPFYGDRIRVNVTEIAAAQPNANRAVGWWQNSALHTRSVSNGSYREVGAAALRTQNGWLYIVVLGSEPDKLTAFPDPRSQTLYLTNEGFSGGQGNWLRSANEYRVLDGQGRILSDWQAWRAQVPLPTAQTSSLTVVYRGGGKEVSTPISLNPADVLLPQYSDVWAAVSPGTVLIASQPTPIPIVTNTPAGAVFVPFATNTLPPLGGVVDGFVATIPPQLQPTLMPPTQVPTQVPPTPVPPSPVPPTTTPLPLPSGGLITPSPRSVTLIYTPQTLAVIPSSAGVNISGIVLSDGARSVRLGNVNAQYLTGSLTSLGARDCILVTVNRSLLSAPSGCIYVSTTFLTPDRALWQVDFNVLINGQPTFSCRAGDQRCFVNLP